MKKKVMFALLLCALLAAGCAGEPEPAQDTQTVQSGEGGEAAPVGTASELGSLKSFTAGTLDGGVFTQEDIAAKEVTVVNFWAMTCGPCIVEIGRAHV